MIRSSIARVIQTRNLVLFTTALLGLGMLVPNTALAQSDAVFKFKKSGGATKLSGTIKDISPLSVTIQTKSGTETVPASQIKKVTAKAEPPGIDRARDRIADGRFDDALEELNKSPANGNPITQSEIDYLKAVATANISLRGGQVTSSQAGQTMKAFLDNNRKSHHFAPATEMMGHLAVAAGDGSLPYAAQQFATLTNSQWPEYVLKGHFFQGETLLKQGKLPEAIQAFDKILAVSDNDDLTQQYKLLATCEKAKAQGLGGQTEPAMEMINTIIRDQNPDNKELFAYAYNARGAVQLKANQVKEARESFLFTDLLFSTEIHPHSEAVYNLASIWQKLENTDRANESRETIKRRYRNSFWATRL